MQPDNSPHLIYFAVLLVIWGVLMLRRIRRNSRLKTIRRQSEQNRLTEPLSLHPVINTNRCIGCQACVYACPEKEYGPVLGVVSGKAALVKPSVCIGHGACYSSCPVDAITLVFGSERRGVHLPHVKSNFETNVDGIFIAGELGGMGLVRNAFRQGVESVDAICDVIEQRPDGCDLDLVIVGAGPAGLAASLRAKEAGLKCVTLDQDTLGGSISHYPRDKIVVDNPVELPLVGPLPLKRAAKREFVQVFTRIVEEYDLEFSFGECVIGVSPISGGAGFRVETAQAVRTAKTVLLAIGRRGTHRRLNVAGEDLPKVMYKLENPESYRGRRILVVGGGDSAVEAACSLAEQAGTEVTLSYRNDTLFRVNERNRTDLSRNRKNGRIRVLFNSTVNSITEERVLLDVGGVDTSIGNDSVLLCTGGELPDGFLRETGIRLETRFGVPV